MDHQYRAGVKGSVTPYDDQFIACLGTVAQHVFDTYGRFPGAFTTMVLPGFVQAVHLDLEFYDKHYRESSYLDSHANHSRRWHGRE